MTAINKTKRALLGATALFAATSAHAQVADSWAIGGDVNVTANNTADTVTLDNTDGSFVDTANIGGGYKNSISGAVVGASASSAFTYFNNSGIASNADAVIDGGVNVIAGSTAAVLNTNDLTGTPTIAGGSGNSISLAAVGSSASGSATTTIAGGATEGSVNFEIGGDILIQSGDGIGGADGADATIGGNQGTVDLAFATGIDTATISGGNSNSISGAAVGSSASFGLAINSTDTSALTEVNYTVGNVNVNATNDETGLTTVSAGGANAVVTGANIAGGDANSISLAAVGASASVSESDTIHALPAAGGGPAAATITMGDIAVNGYNAASITTNAQLDGTPTISGGSNNSISVAGVGSSASVSFGVADYSGAGVSAAATSSGGITIASLNTGVISVTSGMATPTITDGYNNSISNAAVGASASQAISHINLLPPG